MGSKADHICLWLTSKANIGPSPSALLSGSNDIEAPEKIVGSFPEPSGGSTEGVHRSA